MHTSHLPLLIAVVPLLWWCTLRRQDNYFFINPKIARSVVSTQSSSCVVLCKNPVQVLFSHLSINLLCTIYFCSIVLINDNKASLAHACGLVWEIYPYKTMTMLVFAFWHVRAFYTTATLLLGRWSFYWFFVGRGSIPYANNMIITRWCFSKFSANMVMSSLLYGAIRIQ